MCIINAYSSILQALLEYGLSTEGTRAELVKRLDDNRPDIWEALLNLECEPLLQILVHELN